MIRAQPFAKRRATSAKVAASAPPARALRAPSFSAWVKLHPRDDGSTVALGAVALAWDREYLTATHRISEWEKKKEAAKAKIAQAMGLAALAELPSGVRYSFRSAEVPAHMVDGYTRRALVRLKPE